jgi:hypothetical protein
MTNNDNKNKSEEVTDLHKSLEASPVNNNMKQKIKVFLIFFVAVLLTSIVWECYLFSTNFGYSITSPYLMAIADFRHDKHVYLYQSGFRDRDISLCIPLANGFTKIKRITRWHIPDVEVIWSRDGSVLAVEFNEYFFAAYDFKTGNVIAEIESMNNPNINKKITDLINSRAGIGNAIACSSSTFVKMTYKDWRDFREGLKASEQNTSVR